MRLITEAKYATLVDVLAARHPTNVHPCPPHLLSALRLIDLGAPDLKKVLDIRYRRILSNYKIGYYVA